MNAPRTARRIARYAKFVRHGDAQAWLALGWMPHRDLEGGYALDGMPHGDRSVLLVWPCDCSPRRLADTENPAQAEPSARRDAAGNVSALTPTLPPPDPLAIETQRDCDEEGLYGWSIDRRTGM